jgi:hypothetical protein
MIGLLLRTLGRIPDISSPEQNVGRLADLSLGGVGLESLKSLLSVRDVSEQID